MSQTEKYSVATFIEKMVFAKSYSAQLPRSIAGARLTVGSVGWATDGGGSCMNPRVLIDGTSRGAKITAHAVLPLFPPAPVESPRHRAARPRPAAVRVRAASRGLSHRFR